MTTTIMIRTLLTLALLTTVYTHSQPTTNTVHYTYDSQGSITSKTYTNGVGDKKEDHSTTNPGAQGHPQGVLTIYNNGDPHYTVPINIPQGINKHHPTITLHYNNNNTNTIGGIGWSIGGISQITRTPQTPFTDGIFTPITYTKDDKYTLDGIRLINTLGQYGDEGTQYIPQNNTHIKITSHGQGPYGPESFTVEYPDGSTSQYTQNTEHNYNITTHTTLQGLTINYTYNTNPSTINKITYGSRLQDSPPHIIQFIYKNKQHPDQYTISGQTTTYATILSQIITTTNTITYTNYHLTHTITPQGEQLTSIHQTSPDSTPSSPLQFTYTQESLPTTNISETEKITKQLTIPTTETDPNLKSIKNTTTPITIADTNNDMTPEIIIQAKQTLTTYYINPNNTITTKHTQQTQSQTTPTITQLKTIITNHSTQTLTYQTLTSNTPEDNIQPYTPGTSVVPYPNTTP